MVSNTDKALAKTCCEFDVKTLDYTVAPVYFGEGTKGGHQWLIEFENDPMDLGQFSKRLDMNLQSVNSDYEAKRYKSMALENLTVDSLPSNTFYKWMEKRGKLGGQNKVPRLSNNRKYVEEILDFVKTQNGH